MSARHLADRLIRFGVAGLMNTTVGLLVILGLDLGLGLAPWAANAAGYGVGVLVSFGLSRSFVFRDLRPARVTGPRFLIAVAGAFALNQLVLWAAGQALGTTDPARAAAQLLGVGAYSVTLFALSQLWVFAPAQRWKG